MYEAISALTSPTFPSLTNSDRLDILEKFRPDVATMLIEYYKVDDIQRIIMVSTNFVKLDLDPGSWEPLLQLLRKLKYYTTYIPYIWYIYYYTIYVLLLII